MESSEVVGSIIIFVLCMIGFALLLSGIVRFRIGRKYVRTNGVILIRKGFRFDHGKPNVRFHVDGYVYTYTSHIGQKVAFPHGKKVDVLYDPDDPTKVMIDTFIQRGGRRIVGGSLLLFIAIFAIIFVFLFL